MQEYSWVVLCKLDIFNVIQIKAFQQDQKYKEGKYIIEKAYLTKNQKSKDT